MNEILNFCSITDFRKNAGGCMAQEKRAPGCDCPAIHDEFVDIVEKSLKPGSEYMDLAALFKMFSDPTRIKILHALELHELCVCDLACILGLTKSAVSHQLSALKMANLVKYRREGQVVLYSLADEHVKIILDIGCEHLKEDAL